MVTFIFSQKIIQNFCKSISIQTIEGNYKKSIFFKLNSIMFPKIILKVLKSSNANLIVFFIYLIFTFSCEIFLEINL